MATWLYLETQSIQHEVTKQEYKGLTLEHVANCHLTRPEQLSAVS